MAKMSVSGTPGTGTITLGSAVTGFQSFSSAGASNGDIVTYSVVDGSTFETGYGVYGSSGPTLTRTTVKSSSSGGSLVSFTSAATVVLTPIADVLVFRPLANANLKYYVDNVHGSDSNDGLTSGTAFATMYKAWNTICAFDFNGFTGTIQLLNSATPYDPIYNYPGSPTSLGAPYTQAVPFGGTLVIQGDSSNYDNVKWGCGGGVGEALTLYTSALPVITVQWLTLTDEDSAFGYGLLVYVFGFINLQLYCKYKFSNTNSALYSLGVTSGDGAQVYVGSPTITGSCGNFAYTFSLGALTITGYVTSVGTPAWSSSFIYVDAMSYAFVHLQGIVGTATGPRYFVDHNSVIDTGTGNVNYLPGSSAGTTSNGGQYY